jgi:CHAD domain-containing protein
VGTTGHRLRHTPLSSKRYTALPGAAAILLTEMLGQCIANLALVHHSDDPEVVHQARVGWRRFKSGVRLFKPVLDIESAPSWEPLAPLLRALGDLRDCDVALTETLPRIQDLYTEGKADLCEDWAQMAQAMERIAQSLRGAVHLALQSPAVGQTLLAILQWLTNLSALCESVATENTPPPSPHDWALRRLDHLHRRLRTATHDLGPLESQHRARILAKRMRYGTEALQAWIPKKLGQRWGEEASGWQTTLGASRDMARASALAAEAGSDPRLVAFLRGAAAVHQLQGAQPKIKKR